ncbi:MAG: DUF4012 domain-containing protein [Acidimicrobiia bacterium]|nr:DUF4012 domain-containing protein [Acidimicrobiia bacterium]
MRGRAYLWVALGFVLFALAAVGAVTGWHDLKRAREELLAARSALGNAAQDPQSLRTQTDRGQTRAQLDGAVTHITAARRIVHHSPALFVSRFVPLLAQQRHGVDQLIDDSQTGATTATVLLDEVNKLQSQTRLQNGTLPYAGMSEFEGVMRRAGEKVRGLDRSSTWLLGSLRDARQSFDGIARDSATRLLNGADALATARTFLGATGDRHYLVALENNAEMRDQGMVLSYATVSLAGAKIQVGDTGSINALSLKQPAPIQVPAGTSIVFGSTNPNLAWQSVNATADFSWSGRAMAEMYRASTGQPVDGVIAIDVPGLAPLLRAVGPVQVPGIAQQVTADNVTTLILHDLYDQFPVEAETTRQQRLADVARAVIDHLHQGSLDLVSLGRDLGPEVGQGHLRLWSARVDEQRSFERLGVSGGPALVNPARTFHLAVENRTGTKLDYYVRPIVRQDVHLDANGTAVVRTTVTIANGAPVGAKPSYQLGPDEFHTTSHPGDYIAWVLLWGPNGSRQLGSVKESGLELSQYVIPVAAGHQGEVTFETTIPNAVRDGRLDLRLVPQPRLAPADVTARLDAPGWSVAGPTTIHVTWDSVKTLSWKVVH